jgi:hypothetical protein
VTLILHNVKSLLSMTGVQKMFLFIKNRFLNSDQGVVARRVGDQVRSLVCGRSAVFTRLDMISSGMRTTTVGNVIVDIRSVSSFSTKNILLFHSLCFGTSCQQHTNISLYRMCSACRSCLVCGCSHAFVSLKLTTTANKMDISLHINGNAALPWHW